MSGFSGGERSRLALAKLLLEPKNLLFLDEPTNHLDIPASEILEEALLGFEGTVILVSHDRRFLENVTTRIISVRDGVADVYPGGFKDLRPRDAPARRGRDRAGARLPRGSAQERPPADKSDKDAKQKYEAQRQAARDVEKRSDAIQELETSIAAGEKDLDVLRAKLKQGPADDWEKLAKMAQEEQALTRKVDGMLDGVGRSCPRRSK